MTDQPTLKHRLIIEAARRAAAYVDGERDRPVFPTEDALVALGGFAVELPDGPSDPLAVLAQLDELGSPATVTSTGGRYLGFVNGGVEPVAAAASVLSTAWDQNAALPIMSPVAAHLDQLTARWVIDLLGLPTTSTAAFCAGASVANLTALLTGRDALLARVGWDTERSGLFGAPPIKVVTSAEVHVSVNKALRASGIGSDAVVVVPTDTEGRLRPEAMPTCDELTLVVLQAGNVNTGHSDPFDEIIPTARSAGAWVHIDGAFGLWAAATPGRRHLVAGAEQADSWATDAHKWLNAPYDAGLVICADGADLRRSMAVDAAYLPVNAERASMHLGLQMSQRARAIETWAVLASQGRSGVADMIERSCQLASDLANRLADGGAEILAPVVLNQALVAFGDDATTDAVIAAVQDDRRCWVGGTTWQKRRAMRISLSDTSATSGDIAAMAEAILSSARLPGPAPRAHGER